ncbi:MAG: alpha/beta hydrolase [Chroococcales cyanobacterium]
MPFLICAGLGVFSIRGEAAEQVLLKYSFLRETISVAELSRFAETGELSPSLRAYLDMANQNPTEFRKALTDEVEVDSILLYRILNSFPGELLLDQLSNVIHTPDQRADRQSLRAALVSSALTDNTISLIEIFENYPTPVVEIEGDRLVDIARRINRVLGKLPPLPF